MPEKNAYATQKYSQFILHPYCQSCEKCNTIFFAAATAVPLLLLSFLLFRQNTSKHYSFIVIVHMKKHELKRLCVRVCLRYDARSHSCTLVLPSKLFTVISFGSEGPMIFHSVFFGNAVPRNKILWRHQKFSFFLQFIWYCKKSQAIASATNSARKSELSDKLYTI